MRICKGTCCKALLCYVTFACTITSLQCAEDASTAILQAPAAVLCNSDNITEYHPARLLPDAEQAEAIALKCNGAKLVSQPKSTRRLHFSVFKKDQPRVLGVATKTSSAPAPPVSSVDADVRISNPSKGGRLAVTANPSDSAPAPSDSVPEVKGAPMAGVAQDDALPAPSEKEAAAVQPAAPGPNQATQGRGGFWSWFWKREKSAEESERGVRAGGAAGTLPARGAAPAGAPEAPSESGAEEAVEKPAGDREKAAEAANVLQLGSKRAQPFVSGDKSVPWGPERVTGAPEGLPSSVGVPAGAKVLIGKDVAKVKSAGLAAPGEAGAGRKGLPAALALPLPGTLASTAAAAGSAAGKSASKRVRKAGSVEVEKAGSVQAGRAGSVEGEGGIRKDVGGLGGVTGLAERTGESGGGWGREMKEKGEKWSLKKEKKKKKGGGKRKEAAGVPAAEKVKKKKKGQKKKRSEKAGKQKGGKVSDLLWGSRKSAKSSARRRRSQEVA